MKIQFSDEELVKRYKKQYFIPDGVIITIDQVNLHWELEKELTQQLLKSRPDNRWEVFDYCYSILYKELDWLNKYSETNEMILSAEQQYYTFINSIGKESKKIYEVGSGQGKLINYLASLGHECRATEISKERGEKHSSKDLNISWAKSDGIHLDQFEEKNNYDFVISKDVVEHLHPNDLVFHFKGVYEILKPEGSYIFSTPHKFSGPIDISRVFGFKKPMGMHLKEYMIYELVGDLRKAGFKKVILPNRVFTKKFYQYIPFAKNDLTWLMMIEKVMNFFPTRMRNRILQFERRIFPIHSIFLIAEK